MMTIKTQVDDMAQAQQTKQNQATKRKAALSPELNEFLHMLKSLETEFTSSQQTTSR